MEPGWRCRRWGAAADTISSARPRSAARFLTGRGPGAGGRRRRGQGSRLPGRCSTVTCLHAAQRTAFRGGEGARRHVLESGLPAPSSCEGGAATSSLLKSPPFCGPRAPRTLSDSAVPRKADSVREINPPLGEAAEVCADPRGSRHVPRRCPVVTCGTRGLRVARTRLLTSAARYVLEDVAVCTRPQVSESSLRHFRDGSRAKPPRSVRNVRPAVLACGWRRGGENEARRGDRARHGGARRGQEARGAGAGRGLCEPLTTPRLALT